MITITTFKKWSAHHTKIFNYLNTDFEKYNSDNIKILRILSHKHLNTVGGGLWRGRQGGVDRFALLLALHKKEHSNYSEHWQRGRTIQIKPSFEFYQPDWMSLNKSEVILGTRFVFRTAGLATSLLGMAMLYFTRMKE